MQIRQTIKDYLHIILLVALITLVSLGAIWIGLSIYANARENDNPSGLPDFPSESKAEYLLLIRTTGQVVFTDDLTTDLRDRGVENDDLYKLNGYWDARDGKYRHNDSVLILDELYFGDIIVERRQ
jgi:hypothetical protein